MTAAQKIPFKVSARAARLIGRENIANAEGAVAELVKNTYDADAKICVVALLPRFDSIPKALSSVEYNWLSKSIPDLDSVYSRWENDSYLLDKEAEHDPEAISKILSICDLWVLDNGVGMTAKVIEDYWMVIGTSIKEEESVSQGGRARTGAKGIGRFALDKLGTICELTSTVKNGSGNQHSLRWNVDWQDFEGRGKVLDEVEASFTENVAAVSAVVEKLPWSEEIANVIRSQDWEHGTAIRIGLLHDQWSKKEVSRLEKSFRALVPPAEQRELNLVLYDHRSPEEFGQVSSQILEDYDYRIDAWIKDDGDVEIRVDRNELEVDMLPPEIFLREDMRVRPFDLETLKTGVYTSIAPFEEFFPSKDESEIERLKSIGPFRINLLFYKRSAPGSNPRKPVPYRNFQPGPRRAWLDEFGGLKIYRDNFMVRPYGDPTGRSFDWLNLGQKVALNPVAASRRGWNVAPQNLAGTVHISRIDNPLLADQMNREGIIENNAFNDFKAIILRIIRYFEDDRSNIHYNIDQFFNSENDTEREKSEGVIVANRVNKKPLEASGDDARQLAKAVAAQQEEIEEKDAEIVRLREMATLGTVLVSFSHEMGQLQQTVSNRAARMRKILKRHLTPESLSNVTAALNPYVVLNDWEDSDSKIKQWFSFALGSLRADKRRRKWIDLNTYLVKLIGRWEGFLSPRLISIALLPIDETIEVLAFELDLDSIFNNLILNSIEAFTGKTHIGARHISIEMIYRKSDQIQIVYKDNGPGLHPIIKDPRHIFRFNISTKDGQNEGEAGTGLGMWILDSVVRSNKGTATAFRPGTAGGFRLDVTLPCRIKSK